MKLLTELLTLQEDDVPNIKKLSLHLQTELIERLPDDFDISVTDLFRITSLYHNGKIAVRVRHSSFTSLVNGEVYIFPKPSSMSLIYTYRGEYERRIVYDFDDAGFEDLAKDLDGNVQTNSV